MCVYVCDKCFRILVLNYFDFTKLTRRLWLFLGTEGSCLGVGAGRFDVTRLGAFGTSNNVGTAFQTSLFRLSFMN